MEKEYNMTINRLPSKTWNWLRMNETQLERIEIPAAGEAKVTLPEKITTAENECGFCRHCLRYGGRYGRSACRSGSKSKTL